MSRTQKLFNRRKIVPASEYATLTGKEVYVDCKDDLGRPCCIRGKFLGLSNARRTFDMEVYETSSQRFTVGSSATLPLMGINKVSLAGENIYDDLFM